MVCCVTNVCDRGAAEEVTEVRRRRRRRQRRRRRRDTESKTRTPHKDVGKSRIYKASSRAIKETAPKGVRIEVAKR